MATADGRPKVTIGPTELATTWLARFGSALEAKDPDAVAHLFAEDCWLVDRLALTWELRTFHGRTEIYRLLDERIRTLAPYDLELDPAVDPSMVRQGGREWIQASFWFKTPAGRGRGFVRIKASEPDRHLAWTLLLELRELKGYEERRGTRRPAGVAHGGTRHGESWRERRRTAQEFSESDPDAIVIGAGQCGLSVAAHLEQLGVSTLVLEQSERVGDSWRRRYDSLVLHDPVEGNHLPYLEFPDTWPRFIPKDKLADWFEAYVSILELNVWTSARVLDCRHADDGTWSVRIQRDKHPDRVLAANHLIFATGISGLPQIPTIAGADTFRGEIIHSSAYTTAERFTGKRVLVVGAGNSSHDICHDVAEVGAEVTMLQRSQTYVMTSTKGLPILVGDAYDSGLALEDSDHIGNSFPLPVAFELEKEDIVPRIRAQDKEVLAGLRRAGFKIDEEHGLFELYISRGGGYCIDVGASAAIIDGRIKVRSGVQIDHLTQDRVAYSDGSEQIVDVIILATGYGNVLDVARGIVGAETASQCTPVWGISENGDLNSVWGPSGVDGLWFVGGNLAIARHFSLLLALQVKAAEEGLSDRYAGSSDRQAWHGD